MIRNGHFFTMGTGVPSDVPPARERRSKLRELLERHGKGLGWRSRELLMREIRRKMGRGEL